MKNFDLSFRPHLYRRDPARVLGVIANDDHLPSLLPGEVEIARVTLRTEAHDPVSVRARTNGDRISYRIVDGRETEYLPGERESIAPLAMGELVHLLDTCSHPAGFGLTRVFWNPQNPEEFAEGIIVSSEFYPQLDDWYQEDARAWVRRERWKKDPDSLTPLVALLDDEDGLIDALKAIFDEVGIDVAGFPYKDEFLERVTIVRPDVIISDIYSPRMDGTEFLKVIKKDERFKGIPVIMLSGVGPDDGRFKGLTEMGSFRCIQKTGPVEKLIATVSSALVLSCEEQ
jgi:CheY-like chemotaxis protein